MSVWAVVPLKSPESAKSRLSGVLSAPQRLRLFYSLAHRVIDAAMNTSGIAGVTVVTASDAVVAFASNLGAQCLRLDSDRGTAEACSRGLDSLPTHRHAGVLFVAGDLPLISPHALTPFVALAERRPLMAIAGDRRRFGTNALLCTPGDAIPLCFGSDSFAKHLAAAADSGIAAHVVESAALALDIDEPDDLQEWRCQLVSSNQPIDAELHDLFAAQEPALNL
jgi:2-phospho-L-lactate/phosphoenolpyruvate guanylyltransferase